MPSVRCCPAAPELIRIIFRDVRSHSVELKRCPSDPGRISPNVRSSRKYFFENGHSGGEGGSACFEICETEFRYSKCAGQRCVEAPVLRGTIVGHDQWKVEKKWKAREWSISFAGERSTGDPAAWCAPTTFDLRSEDIETPRMMMDGLVQEIQKLGTDPKGESLWVDKHPTGKKRNNRWSSRHLGGACCGRV